MIWNYAKNLQGTSYSEMNQIPMERAERRRQLVPEYTLVKEKNEYVKLIRSSNALVKQSGVFWNCNLIKTSLIP